MRTKPTIKLRPNINRTQTVKTKQLSRSDLDRLSNLSHDYYKPKKKQISIRLDADILAWFKNQPGKYQQLINKACRVFMRLHED